jgi:K+-transporting ATPase KdpF subunit
VGLRTAEVGANPMYGNVIILTICGLLLMYLLAALLWPEKF